MGLGELQILFLVFDLLSLNLFDLRIFYGVRAFGPDYANHD